MKEKVVTAISTIKLLCELKKWQSLILFHCWYGVCVSVCVCLCGGWGVGVGVTDLVAFVGFDIH